LIFKNTNLVGVWISLEVSVIFKRDKFSGYVGVIKDEAHLIKIPSRLLEGLSIWPAD